MGKNLQGKELGTGFSQRPDGRYEARAQIGGVKIDLYSRSLKELKLRFEEEKNKVLTQQIGPDTKVTLAVWFDRWFTMIKEPQLKSEVSRSVYYRKAKNTVIEELGMMRVCDITQMHVQMVANELIDEKNYSTRSVQEAMGVLRECMESAVVNRIITANPVVSIKVKNDYRMVKKRVLSLEEQRIFLEEIRNEYYYEAFCILLLTGMRIGEFSGLQWEDVDYVNKCIYIRRSMSTGYINGMKVEELTAPKTYNSYRAIPFFGETEAMFRSWAQKQLMYKQKMGDRWRALPQHGNLVFTTTVGSPVTRYVLVHILKRVEDNINMKEMARALQERRAPIHFDHLHPHAFRHTFATRCFEKHMDTLVIQTIMGHSNYSTTVSYTHVLDDKLRENVERVGDFFGSNSLLGTKENFGEMPETGIKQ